MIFNKSINYQLSLKLLIREEYVKNYNLISSNTYYYDEDDKLVGKSVERYLAENKQENTLYFYASNGKVYYKEVSVYFKGNILSNKEYTYDSKSVLRSLHQTEYDSKENIKATKSYTYNSKGLKQKQVKKDYKNKKVIKQVTYTYNKFGRLKTEKNSKAYRTTIFFNTKGKLSNRKVKTINKNKS